MRIPITQKDIELGLPNKLCQCPIALAICASTGKDVHVTYKYCVIGTKYYPLPEYARKFILNFDVGREVKPFMLNLIVGYTDFKKCFKLLK